MTDNLARSRFSGSAPARCNNVRMRSDGRGRPRLEQSRRPGKTAREEILDAAAELFTNQGYASTSTRRIADAVGVRQASLYHHFATKDDILDALLTGTVDEPLRLAAELLDEEGPAAPRLHALVGGGVTQLCASPCGPQPVEPRRALPAARATAGPIRGVPAAPRGIARSLPQPRRPGDRRVRRAARRRRPAVSLGRAGGQPAF